mgnify:CR=1 FL=1
MTQSNSPISPLRQRMIDDMALRKMNPRTQQAYIRSVLKLTQFLGRSPHTATAEDLRRFQLHLASNGVSSQTINVTITGLRFFFEVTLEDRQILRKMSAVYEPRKLTVILSPDDVKRLLEAATTLKYKAALSTAYGAGLRASEVAHLKVTDIDSQRMLTADEKSHTTELRQCVVSCQSYYHTIPYALLLKAVTQTAWSRSQVVRISAS